MQFFSPEPFAHALEDAAVIDILVAAIVVAAFAMLALHSYRIHSFALRATAPPPQPRTNLGVIIQSVYPEVRLLRREGISSRRSIADQFPPSWVQWVRDLKRLSPSVAGESHKPGWQDALTLHRLYQIDTHVLEALVNLVRQRIEAFSDLHRPFQWLVHPEGDEAYTDRYDRQFAERIVANRLQASGHTISFADDPERERLLDVDGKPFDVRTFLRFDHQKHFERSPGTSPITPDHFFQQDQPLFDLDPSTALNKVGMLAGIGLDNAFGSGKALAAGPLQAPVFTAAAAGGFDSPNPFLTLGLSSLREIRLLLKRHTNLRTAAKNIGLDVAGTGFGSFAGAKAGATIGTAFGPGVGSVVGAILGGISGALAGRTITNRIKMANAEEARKFYAEKIELFQRRLVEVSAAAREALEEATRKEQALLSQKGAESVKELEALEARLAAVNKRAFVLQPGDVKKLLWNCENELRKKEDASLAALRKCSLWSRVYWPDEATYRLQTQRSSLRQFIAYVSGFTSALLGPGCPLKDSEKTCACLEVLATFGGSEEQIRGHLSRYKATVDESLSALAVWPEEAVRELVRGRAVALSRIKERAAGLRRRTELQLRKDVRKARMAQTRFAKELRKLGLAH